MTVWCERLVVDGAIRSRVRITGSNDGTVSSLVEGVDAGPGDIVVELALPGTGNAHSHAFHRALRGRTHGHGGDFWLWRERMYAMAAVLDPARYHELATAVFAEMLVSGYTAVGEFHYLHHAPDGTPYPQEMELALSEAAADVGIRLTLLDTLYLTGGVDRPLDPGQRRFSDGDAHTYLERWYALAERVPGLGAAMHSARAVDPGAMRVLRDGLPGNIPLHIHLSEQPQENADVFVRYGATPSRLLADNGLLTPRLSVVHATHLTDADVALLGDAGVTVVMCPTTEADLGDGVGPARELLDAGAVLALGSDQNAVVDPLLEIRGLEMHDRLRSGRRGRFTPAELAHVAAAGGYRSLGMHAPMTPGGPFDLVAIDPNSSRTVGAEADQLILVATADDIATVIVGGRVVAAQGELADGRRPAELLRMALENIH